jgi:hypothetical protein
MSTSAKQPADLNEPSSIAEPINELTAPIEEPSEHLPAKESLSAKLNWQRQTFALALAGLAYIAFGDDFRFPRASADSLSMVENGGEPADRGVAQLMVNEATPRPVDQPVPLGVSVDSANDLNFLKVSGFPKGTALSAGVSVGDDGWLLYAKDSKDAVIWPPPHFVGVMKLTVSLIVGADVNPAETRPLRFEWAEKVAELKPPEETRSEAKLQDQAPPLAKLQDEAPTGTISRSHTNRQLSTDETAALLKRGNELIASGDLAAARLVLQRAAEAGNARAAFALAGTYNPITLGELHVHGLSADLAKARYWYERAKELGSPDASRELQALTIRRN